MLNFKEVATEKYFIRSKEKYLDDYLGKESSRKRWRAWRSSESENDKVEFDLEYLKKANNFFDRLETISAQLAVQILENSKTPKNAQEEVKQLKADFYAMEMAEANQVGASPKHLLFQLAQEKIKTLPVFALPFIALLLKDFFRVDYSDFFGVGFVRYGKHPLRLFIVELVKRIAQDKTARKVFLQVLKSTSMNSQHTDIIFSSEEVPFFLYLNKKELEEAGLLKAYSHLIEKRQVVPAENDYFDYVYKKNVEGKSYSIAERTVDVRYDETHLLELMDNIDANYLFKVFYGRVNIGFRFDVEHLCKYWEHYAYSLGRKIPYFYLVCLFEQKKEEVLSSFFQDCILLKKGGNDNLIDKLFLICGAMELGIVGKQELKAVYENYKNKINGSDFQKYILAAKEKPMLVFLKHLPSAFVEKAQFSLINFELPPFKEEKIKVLLKHWAFFKKHYPNFLKQKSEHYVLCSFGLLEQVEENIDLALLINCLGFELPKLTQLEFQKKISAKRLNAEFYYLEKRIKEHNSLGVPLDFKEKYLVLKKLETATNKDEYDFWKNAYLNFISMETGIELIE